MSISSDFLSIQKKSQNEPAQLRTINDTKTKLRTLHHKWNYEGQTSEVLVTFVL